VSQTASRIARRQPGRVGTQRFGDQQRVPRSRRAGATSFCTHARPPAQTVSAAPAPGVPVHHRPRRSATSPQYINKVPPARKTDRGSPQHQHISDPTAAACRTASALRPSRESPRWSSSPQAYRTMHRIHREHLSWLAAANWGRMPLSSGRRLSPLLLPRQSVPAGSRIHVDATIRVPGAAVWCCRSVDFATFVLAGSALVVAMPRRERR
jgi:hypothetical protein